MPSKSLQDEDGALTKTITKYGSSNLFYQIFNLGNALLKPKLLSPELLGLWSLLNLIPQYSTYLHLGSRTSMRYQLPKYLAEGKDEACRETMGAVYYGTLALSIIAASILTVFSLMSPLGREARWGIWTMTSVLMMSCFFLYQVCVLKAYQRFDILSNVNYIRAALLSVLNVVLILFFGIYGLYAAIFVTSLSILLYLKYRYRMPHPGPYGHRRFIGLIRQGFPIMIYNVGGILVASSDKLIISALLGLEQLGYYGIAAMTLNFLMQVPGASREVVESKLIEMMATDRKKAVEQYLLRPLMVTAYLIPFFIGSGVILLPEAVKLLFPNYLPGVEAAQIILLGGFPLSLSYVLRGGIVASNIQGGASLIMLTSALINFLASWLLVQFGWGLSGIALSSAFSFLFLFLSLQIILTRKIRLWDSWQGIITVFYPFAFMLLFLFVAKKFFLLVGWPPMLERIISVLFFITVMYAIYNVAARKTGLFKPFILAGKKRKF